MQNKVYAAMEKLDNKWDVDGFDPLKISATVEDIHLCALRNDLNEGDELGNPPTNHWVVCLQTSPTSSVILDMAPGYGSDGLRGKIEVAALNQPYTDETLQLVAAGSASSAKEALTKYWVNPEGSYPREMNEGFFRE